ncbi:DNA cytosine methyltransferase [Candidatus Cyanaurora vandensis]|uniref:DNA cytosine methyltransferase n=1 Tax=Candidatus Cyanaurora vandensis TaxID=2714958 RepID=UPI00257DF2F5|nr:DNA (cytosine-5-)-methyltransferase [Candidatus Cyanaurora vandensis]
MNNPNACKTLRVASFFSGIGGFDLAFEQAGCELVFQCEKDGFCQKVLKKHWPDIYLAPDITQVSPKEIPEAEIWCGGFPCQDLSLANQGKRQGLEGQRSGLFTQFAKLVDTARPKWLVIENVPGLLNSGSGQDFKHVLETLDDLGYFVAWRILDAKYFGTPQRRRRVFLVASYQSDSAARVLFEQGVSSEMVGAVQTQVNSTTEFTRSSFQESDLFTIQHATIGRKPAAGPQAKGYRNDGETYTLDSRGSADVVCAPHDGFRIRSTPGVSRELDSRRLRALGNAVCVYVVRWLAQRLIQEESGRVLNVNLGDHAHLYR